MGKKGAASQTLWGAPVGGSAQIFGNWAWTAAGIVER